MRSTATQIKLGDVQLPAGTTLCYSPYVLFKDERLHADSLRFDPDRWLPERIALLPREANSCSAQAIAPCPGNIFALSHDTVM